MHFLKEMKVDKVGIKMVMIFIINSIWGKKSFEIQKPEPGKVRAFYFSNSSSQHDEFSQNGGT